MHTSIATPMSASIADEKRVEASNTPVAESFVVGFNAAAHLSYPMVHDDTFIANEKMAAARARSPFLPVPLLLRAFFNDFKELPDFVPVSAELRRGPTPESCQVTIGWVAAAVSVLNESLRQQIRSIHVLQPRRKQNEIAENKALEALAGMGADPCIDLPPPPPLLEADGSEVPPDPEAAQDTRGVLFGCMHSVMHYLLNEAFEKLHVDPAAARFWTTEPADMPPRTMAHRYGETTESACNFPMRCQPPEDETPNAETLALIHTLAGRHAYDTNLAIWRRVACLVERMCVVKQAVPLFVQDATGDVYDLRDKPGTVHMRAEARRPAGPFILCGHHLIAGDIACRCGAMHGFGEHFMGYIKANGWLTVPVYRASLYDFTGHCTFFGGIYQSLFKKIVRNFVRHPSESAAPDAAVVDMLCRFEHGADVARRRLSSHLQSCLRLDRFPVSWMHNFRAMAIHMRDALAAHLVDSLPKGEEPLDELLAQLVLLSVLTYCWNGELLPSSVHDDIADGIIRSYTVPDPVEQK